MFSALNRIRKPISRHSIKLPEPIMNSIHEQVSPSSCSTHIATRFLRYSQARRPFAIPYGTADRGNYSNCPTVGYWHCRKVNLQSFADYSVMLSHRTSPQVSTMNMI